VPVLDEDTAWQHCDESRRLADKLLIRPYEVDQAGTGVRAGRQIPTKASTCIEPVHLGVMPAAHRHQTFSQCIYPSAAPGVACAPRDLGRRQLEAVLAEYVERYNDAVVLWESKHHEVVRVDARPSTVVVDTEGSQCPK
jgi:hypothetical protein